MMDKRSLWWVGCIAFVVIVAATACTAFFVLLWNGYDQDGARYGALLYGAMIGIPLWLAVLGIALKSANLLAAAKFTGRIEEIVETRRSGETGRRRQ
jgi:formate-dependent nitrite reductase membrane component NrfD